MLKVFYRILLDCCIGLLHGSQMGVSFYVTLEFEGIQGFQAGHIRVVAGVLKLYTREG